MERLTDLNIDVCEALCDNCAAVLLTGGTFPTAWCGCVRIVADLGTVVELSTKEAFAQEFAVAVACELAAGVAEDDPDEQYERVGLGGCAGDETAQPTDLTSQVANEAVVFTGGVGAMVESTELAVDVGEVWKGGCRPRNSLFDPGPLLAFPIPRGHDDALPYFAGTERAPSEPLFTSCLDATCAGSIVGAASTAGCCTSFGGDVGAWTWGGNRSDS